MKHRFHARFRRLAHSMPAVAIIALLTLHSAPAQSPQPPTLDQIVLQLEKNLRNYETRVPSFFCNEHALSQIDPSRAPGNTITDSIFRLKRTTNPNQTASLEESRDIKTVNGKPASGETLNGPAVLRGAFSGGIGTVSIEQQACMRYRLLPIKHPGKPYIVEFTSIYKQGHPQNCLLPEEGSGRVFIDPATLQIKRMELIAPDHTMVFGNNSQGVIPPPVNGVWTITIDYAPILLGTQTFWMPTNITSSMTASGTTSAPNATAAWRRTTWSFNAHYSNYHKLDVTSRIVPVP